MLAAACAVGVAGTFAAPIGGIYHNVLLVKLMSEIYFISNYHCGENILFRTMGN